MVHIKKKKNLKKDETPLWSFDKIYFRKHCPHGETIEVAKVRDKKTRL